MVALLHNACPDYFPAHALDHLRAGADEGRSESVKGKLYQAGWGGEAASGASGLWNIVPGRIMLKFGIAPVRAAGVFLLVYRSRLCTSLAERAILVICSVAFALRKGLTRAKRTLRYQASNDTPHQSPPPRGRHRHQTARLPLQQQPTGLRQQVVGVLRSMLLGSLGWRGGMWKWSHSGQLPPCPVSM